MRSRRAVLVVGIVCALAACSESDDACVGAGSFVLRNRTSVELRAIAPFAAPDSAFTVAVSDSVVLGTFEGEFPGSFPDVRDLMACLTVLDAAADTLVYRLSPTAGSGSSGLQWVFERSGDCTATFTLTLADSLLGTDAGEATACTSAVDLRLWSAAGR